MAVVYLITHRVSGRGYIGQTTNSNPVRRWHGHICDASKKAKCAIDRAIAKYGPQAFSFEILVQSSSQEELNDLEKLWIIALGTQVRGVGFNIRNGGSRGRHSESTKEKLRDARSRQVITPEMYRKGAEKRRGKIRSEIHRKHLSEANKGKAKSAEARSKMSDAALIRVSTPDAKKKWSEFLSIYRGRTPGFTQTTEVKLLLSKQRIEWCKDHPNELAIKGKAHSEAMKAFWARKKAQDGCH